MISDSVTFDFSSTAVYIAKDSTQHVILPQELSIVNDPPIYLSLAVTAALAATSTAHTADSLLYTSPFHFARLPT